ncbi:MAG: alpha/beta hydrolase [Anaerolineae bacterium]|nr:alpha/beta hydrolase [Anaerolineae bacterium]
MIAQNSDMVRQYRPIEALKPAHWRLDSFPTSDGISMYYHRTGGSQLPPVILLHGFQSAGLTWLRTTQALEGAYNVILPDFRGHGYSSTSVQGFALERLTQDIAELIGHLNLKPTYVVGHSLGAEIAGRVAAVYPALVRAVVLVDPPMRAFVAPKPTEQGGWFQHWFAAMQALKSQTHEERLVATLRLLPPNTPIWGEADFVPFANAQAQFNLDVLQSAGVMDYRVASPELASRITAPLLLVLGSAQQGSVASTAGTEVIKSTGSQREIVTLPDAGHFIAAEQFDTFIQTVEDFLQQH